MVNAGVLLCWSPRDPAKDVYFLTDPPDFLRQGGGARWTVRDRERGKSVTEFGGVDPHTMLLELIFDSVDSPEADGVGDVNRQLHRLHLLSLPTSSSDPFAQPPVVRLVNASHTSHLDWVVNKLDWKWHDWVRDAAGSATVRVAAEVHVELLEYRAAKLALSPVEAVGAVVPVTPVAQPGTAPAGGAAAPAGSPTAAGPGDPTGSTNQPQVTRVVVVGQDETLRSIALRELGAADRWVEVARLSGVANPDLVVAGQQLRVPAR